MQRRIQSDDSGVIPFIIIGALIVIMVVLVCLYLWPIMTIGALLIAGGFGVFLTVGNPKISMALIAVGGAMIAYGMFWG